MDSLHKRKNSNDYSADVDSSYSSFTHPDERPLIPNARFDTDNPQEKAAWNGLNSTQPMSSRRLWARINFQLQSRPNFWVGVVICFLAFATRFYKVHLPASICWDETHFGKHASYYIKGTYFFDVHPPLAKMLIALAGALTGYNGEFDFKNVGQPYGTHSYMGMRMFCAALGAAIPMFVYGIMLNLQFNLEAAVIAALLLVFDNGITTLSRFILLDQPLMFFIIGSVYCYTKFYTLRDRAFQSVWWKWMMLTGTFLACAFGSKWVGLFVIAFVGLSTVKELWDMLGDLNMPLSTLVRHFIARVLCLIILPITLYLSFFAIHFAMLPKTGPGDGFMSSAFQTTLRGNLLYDAENPVAIAYDSEVTIKQFRANGALLHSHKELYPKELGPPQQQVTTYSFKDDNNRWRIRRSTPGVNPEVQFVKHGDMVRVTHIPTNRNLHTHNEKAPITTKHKQVTGYGKDGEGDDNDVWQILIDGVEAGPEEVAQDSSDRYHIKLLTTKFRLVHKNQKCALSNQGVKLPKWGFEQGEVSCNPVANEFGSLWNIESIIDDRLPKAKVADLRPSFMSKVIEAHLVMAYVNNDLKPKENENPSRPWHWPVLYKGQHFTGWGESDIRVFLMGNPVIWWGNLVAIVIFAIGWFANAALLQRGFKSPFFKKRRALLQDCGGWVFLGYILHYLPFYTMSRVLYFHHYYPALIFSCMLTAIVLDELFFWVWVMGTRLGLLKSRRVVHVLVGGCIAILAASFLFFSPFTYGMTGPLANYSRLKWRDSWDVA